MAQSKEERLERQRQYRKENKEKISAYNRARWKEKRAEIQAQKRRWYEANKENVAAKSREWQEANRERYEEKQRLYYIENKEVIIAKQKVYRQRNKERIAEAARGYKRRNPEKVAAQIRNWSQKNRVRVSANQRARRQSDPWRSMAHSQNRRSRLAQAEGTFTAEEWRDLCEQWDNRCAYCGHPTKKVTVDHVVPLSKGGTNFISNILPACLSCNSAKNNKDLDVFVQRLPLDSPIHRHGIPIPSVPKESSPTTGASSDGAGDIVRVLDEARDGG